MAQPPKGRQEETPPPRRGWFAAVGNDAGHAANAIFLKAGFTDPALVLHWSEIAGPEVARLARPVRFSQKDGTLTLMAEPAAALFLGHESRTLAARINAWAGRSIVTRVKFTQGRLSQRVPPPSPPRPAISAKTADPSNGYRGPAALKAALQSLARWRLAAENRGD